LAEYLDLDPSIVRLLFVLLALTFGNGILIYLILLLVMPMRPEV
jgi:phage shock protein PspC (stress-responsive transcriptional regulator)